jgi:hypothetical protein
VRATVIKANTSFEDLKKLKVEPPETAGSRHVIVQHYPLLKLVRKTIKDHWYKPGEVRVATNQNGLDMLAAIEVVGVSVRMDAIPWLGVMNANSRLRRSAMYAGVTYRDTAVVLKKYEAWKHDTTLDMKQVVKDTCDRFMVDVQEFPKLIKDMRRTPADDGVAGGAIMRAVQDKLIPITGSKDFMVHRLDADQEFTGEDAWGVVCCFGLAMLDREPITDNPRMDTLRQMYEFYRLVMGS